MTKWPVLLLLACSALLVAPPPPAQAFTRVDELIDVKPSHWAYKALKELVEKYNLLEGLPMPDMAFRGEDMATRYDLAQLLYNAMQYLAKRQVDATPASPPVDVTREDRDTLLRLAQEFKPELDRIKARVGRLDQRIARLERGVKITGEVEIAFRDRLSVAEGGAPFGVIDPGATSSYYTLFTSNNLNPFTESLRLKLLAQLTPNLRYEGSLRAMYSGIQGANTRLSVAGGVGNHWFDEGSAAIPLFVEKSALTWEAWDFARDGVGITFKAGLMNLDELVHPGTSFPNRFNSEAWVGHGFGLVGFGAHKAAATDATCAIFDQSGLLLGARAGCGSAFVYTGRLLPRFWGSGIDANGVDPNSKRYARLPSLGVGSAITFVDKGALRFAAGIEQGPFGRYTPPGRFGRAFPGGMYVEQEVQDDLAPGFTDISGRRWHDHEVFSGGTNLVAPSFYTDNYWVGSVTFDMNKLSTPTPFLIKLNGQFWNKDPYFGYATTRDEINAVFDFDFGKLWEEDAHIGYTLQFSKSVKSYRQGQLRPDVISTGVMADNFFNTGLGWGIGAKIAMLDMFDFTGKSRGDYSLGGYVFLPRLGHFPGMLFALQQSFGPGITPGTPAVPSSTPPPGYQELWFANSGGLTIQFPFRNIMGTPVDAVLEVDSLFEGSLFDFRNVATDVSLTATLRF